MPGKSAVAIRIGAASSGGPAVLGWAPAFAMGMTYATMADSLGLAMQNAAANQQRMQVITSAAVMKVVALIHKIGASP
jgi:hypothetical protein